MHDKLQGWVFDPRNAEEVREALDRAFDYRGDVTITLKNGNQVEGYVFDRRVEGPSLRECFIRVMPKDRQDKVLLRYSEIAGVAFSGRDTAEGRRFELWMKNYREKKALGEQNVSIGKKGTV